MIDAKTVDRYLKVRALAQGSSGAEADTAKGILSKMEKDFPGIKAEADRVSRERETPPKPQWDDPQPQPWRGGNWEELFNFARGFVNDAYDFANTMANAYVGTHLAQRNVTSATRRTRSGNAVISFSMPLRTYIQTRDLNGPQQQAFRQELHDMLDAELDKVLDH